MKCPDCDGEMGFLLGCSACRKKMIEAFFNWRDKQCENDLLEKSAKATTQAIKPIDMTAKHWERYRGYNSIDNGGYITDDCVSNKQNQDIAMALNQIIAYLNEGKQ